MKLSKRKKTESESRKLPLLWKILTLRGYPGQMESLCDSIYTINVLNLILTDVKYYKIINSFSTDSDSTEKNEYWHHKMSKSLSMLQMKFLVDYDNEKVFQTTAMGTVSNNFCYFLIRQSGSLVHFTQLFTCVKVGKKRGFQHLKQAFCAQSLSLFFVFVKSFYSLTKMIQIL